MDHFDLMSAPSNPTTPNWLSKRQCDRQGCSRFSRLASVLPRWCLHGSTVPCGSGLSRDSWPYRSACCSSTLDRGELTASDSCDVSLTSLTGCAAHGAGLRGNPRRGRLTSPASANRFRTRARPSRTSSSESGRLARNGRNLGRDPDVLPTHLPAGRARPAGTPAGWARQPSWGSSLRFTLMRPASRPANDCPTRLLQRIALLEQELSRQAERALRVERGRAERAIRKTLRMRGALPGDCSGLDDARAVRARE